MAVSEEYVWEPAENKSFTFSEDIVVNLLKSLILICFVSNGFVNNNHDYKYVNSSQSVFSQLKWCTRCRCFCFPWFQVKIWMQHVFLTTSSTLVALIMHTDKLLLDADLLFQKVGEYVQHTLLIEWSSCTLKWIGMSFSLSFFFSFDILFCMCNVYISTSEEPTWFESLPEAGNQTKSFPFCQVMDSFTWGKMNYFKGKGHPLSASQTDSNGSTSKVIAHNCNSKRNSPSGYTTQNKRHHFTEL